MRILRNHILNEIQRNFWSTLLILTFMLLVGNIFTRMIDLVVNRGVDLFQILQLFAYSAPFLLIFTIPMAMLVATLLAFGRMSADHELVAVRASGVSMERMVRPILIVAAILSLFSFYLNDQIASESHFKMRQVSSQIGMQSPAAALEEGVFKSDYIRLGDGCSIGPGAFVHYGVTMGDHVVLDADAFLMKGEVLDSHTGWRGNPAKMVRGGVAHDATVTTDETTGWQEPFVQRIAAE